jgi:hypothetical protein
MGLWFMIASQHGKDLPKLFGFEVRQVVKQNSASGRRALPFLGGIFRLGKALVGSITRGRDLPCTAPASGNALVLYKAPQTGHGRGETTP